MKVGDLVIDIHPYVDNRVGIIIEKCSIPGMRENEAFRVLWSDGCTTTGWDYDLKVINESR